MPPGRLRDEVSIERLKHDLFQYYKTTDMEKKTRVQGLTLLMLRSPQPFKGAETKHMIAFALQALTLASQRVAGLRNIANFVPLVRAGQCLVHFSHLCDRSEAYPSDDIKREMILAGVGHCVWALRGGVPFQPKHHQALHLFHSVWRMGNPTRHANFVDEGLNRILASVAGRAHALVWEARILSFWSVIKRTREIRRAGRIT